MKATSGLIQAREKPIDCIGAQSVTRDGTASAAAGGASPGTWGLVSCRCENKEWKRRRDAAE